MVMMEKFLRGQSFCESSVEEAKSIAIDAWVVGHMALTDESEELPSREKIAAHRQEQLRDATVEAALLDRKLRNTVAYRLLHAEPEEPKQVRQEALAELR